ncbi:Na(+)/citrate cotransporter-like isoform X2 [Amphiura filiformis]|uniref:Na(+)/citrate cotransporter-like isoform X2 n=1 Tax=Amphiura filiformis TaxID=82378 RepID=UPI003B21164A
MDLPKVRGSFIVMAGYWIFEVVPLAVTSLLPVVLYPLLGVQESDDVCRNYLKDTNFLFVGGLIVAVAVEHWNLHKRIALSVLMLMGSQPRWLMLGFMLTTAFLSMWISNTATTAMMIPIAQAVLLQLVGENKKLFKGEEGDDHDAHKVVSSNDDDPPSYQMDGGNDNPMASIEDEKETQVDGEEKSANKQDFPKNPEIEDTTKEIEESAVTGDTIDWEKLNEEERNLSKGLMLCVCYAANIGGTATLTGTGPNLVIGGVVDDLYGAEAGLNFASWMFFALPGMIINLFLAWLWLQFLYLGRSCVACCRDCTTCITCGKKGNTANKAGHEVIKNEYKKLGSISWAEASVLCHFIVLALLWLLREPGFIPGFPGWSMLFPVSEYISDATAAIFISFLLFVFPSQPPNFLCCRTKNDTSEIGPRPALLDWKTAQRKLPWSVILLLGGGFALADGCQVSGLSHWLGGQFESLSFMSPVTINIIIVTIICFFTEFTSNTATATIFLPILAAVAESICVNPLYLMIPATVVCSYAFMLPVATPPNAIAFSYGTLTVPDMAKAGIVMNIMGICLINLMINTLGAPMFDVFNYPEWAPDINGTCRDVDLTTLSPNMTTMYGATTTCVCY